MRYRNVCLLTLAWTILNCCGTILTSPSLAQVRSTRARQIPVLLQGEEIKLPEDFVARLDGDKLKVALNSMGLTQKYPDSQLLVTLIQDGGSKQELSPDANGELVFDNVKEGLASIVVASGQMAYAALALYAVPSIDNNNVKPFAVPVASVEVEQIRTGVETAGQGAPDGAAKQFSDYVAAPKNQFAVYLQNDGTLKGLVIVPQVGYEQAIGPVDLTFFREGRLVGKTQSDNNGYFLVAGLQPGVHSVFATGAAGHTAFAFEILPFPVNDLSVSRQPSATATRLVAARMVQNTPSSELIVLIIPPRMMSQVREVVRSGYPLLPPTDGALVGNPLGMPLNGMPFAPGVPGIGGLGPTYSSTAFGQSALGSGGFGYGGGFGGGGFAGGGFGGGGIGGLLGIAGLAVGVAAISTGDGGTVNVATPISR